MRFLWSAVLIHTCPATTQKHLFYFTRPYLSCSQRPGQCYGPACGDNDYQGQDYMLNLNFSKKTIKKTEIYSKNSYEKSQKRYNNHDRAQQCNGRLGIKRTIMTEDFASYKHKYRSSHPAGWARQVVFLLKATGSKPATYINPAICRKPEKSEESKHRQKYDRRSSPLATRCTAEIFWFI